MRRLFIVILTTLFVLMATAQNGEREFTGDRHPYVEYLTTVNHADRNYRVGEEAVVTVTAYKGGIPLDGVELRYSVGGEMVLSSPSMTTTFKDGVATIPMGTATEPGFRECDLEFEVFGKTYRDVVKVGYDIDRIKPYTVMPKDFERFWQQEIKKARAVNLDPHLTYMPQHSDDQVAVYLVRLTVGEGKTFYGYLSKPKSLPSLGKGSGVGLPMMFCPPGAGPYKRSPQKEFAYKGFVVLNIDIHGLNPELSKEYFDAKWDETFDYWNRGLQSRDSCYYRQVYAGCVRCIDYLTSLPEWDGKNVVCKDGSQGGALSIVTAALYELSGSAVGSAARGGSPALRVCAFYPALCDLTGFGHGRAGGWPKYFFAKSPERRPTDKVLTLDDKAEIETLQYYDVVNFTRILRAPGYYYFGYNDNYCSPTSIYGMLNEMKAQKTVSVTYTNQHFSFDESRAQAAEWVMKQIK